MKKILVIEDNSIILDSIMYSLKKENYFVEGATTGEAGIILLKEKKFDLVLLDLMLPGISGTEFLDKIQQYRSKLAIIIISSLDDELTQISLFSKQVDDYITKPFSMNILLLKLESIFRRIKGNETSLIIYKDISLEVNNYNLIYKGAKIEITPKEFEVLQLLMLNQGRIFSREDILYAIWGYETHIDDRTVDVYIKKLRNKLYKKLITTITGVGYRIDNII